MQNNLGVALAGQGTRTEGAAGAGLLAEATAAYRAALEVRTRSEHPAAWAGTQDNLGLTLADQAGRTEGAAGAVLFNCAVGAHRAALEVLTRAAHPVDWAMAQNNLGNALTGQAGRTEGAARAVLLDEAVAAYRAALEVRTRAARAADWAITQQNLALVFEAIGDDEDEPDHRYAEALACLDAALEVFEADGLERNRADCEGNRARVAGKLGCEDADGPTSAA